MLRNHLKHWRKLRGLTQQELARRAGVTRQTIGGVESGTCGLGVELALRMSRALACRLEDLFELEDRTETVRALRVDPPSARPERVALADIGGRTVARRLDGLGAYRWPAAAAHGIARPSGSGSEVEVRRLSGQGRGLFMVGCDPALGLLAGHTLRLHEGVDALWWQAGNARAVEQLRRGEAHVAAVHGPRAEARRTPAFPVSRFRVAAWEMGWMLRPVAGESFAGVEDLVGRDLTLANREEGSGARGLLDRLLASAGVPADRIAGYRRPFAGHMEVAQAVALGVADVGIGIGAAAAGAGLRFIPLVAEVSDLWVLPEHLDDPVVAAALEVLNDGTFRRDLGAFGPYDTAETGKDVGAHAA